MREERLLERIRRWEQEPLGRGREDLKRAIESVVRHLQRLLNTRQGSVPIADDYGIPDLMHFMQRIPETAGDMENAIREVIEKYEPRLMNVRVRYVPPEENELLLRFQVQARMRKDAKPVLFETLLGPDGKMDVRG
jgi:type VI secretion system protein